MSEFEFLKPGYFVDVVDPDTNISRYRQIESIEPGRYVHTWDEAIAAGSESSEQALDDLKPLNTAYLYQCVFGIKGPAFVYLNLPLETRLWGTGKKPIATSANRRIGHLTQEDSPFENPSGRSQFFLMKGGSFEYPSFSAYNPTHKPIVPELDIRLARCRLSDITDPALMDKLSRSLVPSMPVTFGGLPPVRSGSG